MLEKINELLSEIDNAKRLCEDTIENAKKVLEDITDKNEDEMGMLIYSSQAYKELEEKCTGNYISWIRTHSAENSAIHYNLDEYGDKQRIYITVEYVSK